MTPLTSAQRAELKRLAHHLDPLVLVGKGGASDMLARSVSDALEAHELIKIKFNDHKSEKKQLLEELIARTGGQVVSIVGHVATVYKQQADPERRKIEI